MAGNLRKIPAEFIGIEPVQNTAEKLNVPKTSSSVNVESRFREYATAGGMIRMNSQVLRPGLEFLNNLWELETE
jgi:hypothetical protein